MYHHATFHADRDVGPLAKIHIFRYRGLHRGLPSHAIHFQKSN